MSGDGVSSDDGDGVARMWEARIMSGQLDAFCVWVRDEAWPQLAAAPGFVGGEVYRSHDGEDRAVVVSRWASADAMAAGNEWFDLGSERFCEHEAHDWDFTPVIVA